MAESYDVVVIGGGAVGENAAGRAVQNGLSAALIERELVGGECTYWACMPSKALLRPGEAVAEVRRTPGAREAVTGSIDVAATLGRRDQLASHWDDSSQLKWLETMDVAWYRGHGRIVGERRVVVEDAEGSRRELEANRAVVVATGSRAAVPPIEGLPEAEPWGSRKATSAGAVPASLLVLGGSNTGLELAQAWRRLGADPVTVVDQNDRLLPALPDFAGELLGESLTAEGIDIRLGGSLTRVARRDNGAISAVLDSGEELEAAELLVATGRKPVTDNLGLEEAGLSPGQYIRVNDQMRAVDAAGDWLYAVGDVTGRNLLTHMGKYQARICADVIGGRETAAWSDHWAVPGVTFTDPQVAKVGLTEAAAKDHGISVRTVEHPFGAVAGAATQGEGIKGRCQLVVDADRRVVVGATFVGPGAGEQLHAATIAIAGEVPLERLWHAVPAFPTLSENWLRLLEHYGL
ncbi:pyridine nucleotide-disulfide oxidoreductase [Thiohalorhabdus denitrificans]|uniref:Dihydrolipoamide dehydrogenase n=1 Tax=Thiohalorhabdus denitrificans TaxID=381306 RepID=A0A0P9CFS2_9GAMM|nr:NAD(P)/FAD-dependent oxidoreductase [Thiohalorhabdus denitrificans]KPV41865.1 pyridine nucleotide-disulfide oxidoreductase [Thiohalorhabdus denitrificans]SCY64888.1 dihydrolipoamide dehydrogenase [Thiohalorhabdus denitrificans]